MKEPPSQTLQQTLKDLEAAFKNFFKGTASFPSKKKKSQASGFRFPAPKSIQIIKHSNKRKGIVDLPKIGRVKYFKSRDLAGEMRSATISKDGSSFYISFLCKLEVEIPQPPNGSIGIDRGIAHTIAVSKLINNSNFLDLDVKKIKKLELRIAFYQKKLAKLKKFSSNWRKFQRKIARLHKHITNIRQDFLWKSAREITKSHGLIFLEKLKTKNMSKSASGSLESPGKMVAAKSGLNRAILRQGWHSFQVKLEHKAQEFGCIVEYVNPRNTSRECSSCSHTDKENRKTQEVFACVSCGYTENADINASKNIEARGLRVLALKDGAYAQAG